MAKDVLQDGFVALFDKISTYKSEGSFEGWARKIFVNTALMQLRRNDALKFSDNIEDSQAMQMVQSNTLEKIGSSISSVSSFFTLLMQSLTQSSI